ncbi:MAG: DUF3082 domain-containing protein [Phormidium tanganyikae FI6-MK23]|nr:DUF3082 domain-containing protein [Phormidium tanganyikae FI6-MK23]
MTNSPKPETPQMPSPLRCFIGAILAGLLAYALYNMTSAIGLSFATKPISTDSFTVRRISSAVRTLVIGMSAMGTGIFGLATFGLAGLGIQLLFRKPEKEQSSSD